MERLDHKINHEWHSAINRHSNGMAGSKDWPHFMYEAKTLADEVPRMALLFKMERENALPKMHKQCSHSEAQAVPDNHLKCCLGVVCRECPHLLSLEKAKATPEQIDQFKAWTCAAHIVGKGGDVSGEGYILTIDDRMYWDRVYSNLSMEPQEDMGL